MKFTFQRDRTIASLFGHSIFFPKGVATHVPPEMYREVISAGGVSDEEVDIDAPPPPPEKAEITDPAAREKAIFDVFEVMALRNARGDFTATGFPHMKVIARELGWPISDKERDLMWAKFQEQGTAA